MALQNSLSRDIASTDTGYPEGVAGERWVASRQRRGSFWAVVFMASTLVGIIALMALLYNVVNSAFGYVMIQNEIEPEVLVAEAGLTGELSELPKETLAEILREHVSAGLIRRLENDKPLAERTQEEVYELVMERVVESRIVESWSLTDSMFQRSAIEAEVAATPGAELTFRSWLTLDFVTSPQSSQLEYAGVRTAILGSLWVIFVTILFSLPVGVGAAIYLEEYAANNRFSRLVETTINNLAGVPSIIYGMLGLVIFVRMLEALTSGRIFGVGDPTTANGRTILSAGLTLGLLILPLLIINAREAIRAVPSSLRQAAFALGFVAPGKLWVGSHQVADHLEPCFAWRTAGNFDGNHLGDFACDWRNCAAGGNWSFDLYCGGPR